MYEITALDHYQLSIAVLTTKEQSVCCSVLQCVAVCCSVLQCVAVLTTKEHSLDYKRLRECYRETLSCGVAVCCSVLQCAAACCSVLQCVAVCCTVLQCVAVLTTKEHSLDHKRLRECYRVFKRVVDCQSL